MRRFAVWGFLAVLAAGTAASAQDAKKGEQLFVDQKCTLCHSVAGKGNQKGKLDGVGSELTADQIRAWLTDPVTNAAKEKKDRKPAMKPVTLPKEDVDALVAYVSSLKKK